MKNIPRLVHSSSRRVFKNTIDDIENDGIIDNSLNTDPSVEDRFLLGPSSGILYTSSENPNITNNPENYNTIGVINEIPRIQLDDITTLDIVNITTNDRRESLLDSLKEIIQEQLAPILNNNIRPRVGNIYYDDEGNRYRLEANNRISKIES